MTIMNQFKRMEKERVMVCSEIMEGLNKKRNT
jgi:hypothetical protein